MTRLSQIDQSKPLWTLSDFSGGYQPEKTIVKSIDIELYGGQVVGLIGPNGSGKTSLLRGMSGVLPISSGHVYDTEKKDIKDLQPRVRAQSISLLAQNAQKPSHMKVRDYVLLGGFPQFGYQTQIPKEMELRLDEVLEKFDLTSCRDSHLGLLSGGQFQRVRLAQMYYQDTPIMLMDEPASFLDWDYQTFLVRYVSNLVKEQGKAIIITLHDFNLARLICDKLILMNQGAIVKEGLTEDVLRDEILQSVYQYPPIQKDNYFSIRTNDTHHE